MEKKYETDRYILILNKYLSGRRNTRRKHENINPLHEKLIEDQRISARKNSLDISKSTLNRITKRDLKWHPYKMHVRKERNNHKWSYWKEIRIYVKELWQKEIFSFFLLPSIWWFWIFTRVLGMSRSYYQTILILSSLISFLKFSSRIVFWCFIFIVPTFNYVKLTSIWRTIIATLHIRSTAFLHSRNSFEAQMRFNLVRRTYLTHHFDRVTLSSFPMKL